MAAHGNASCAVHAGVYQLIVFVMHARRYETASCATFVRTVIPGSVALHKHALLLSVYFLTIAHLGLSNVGISLQLFVLNVHNTQYYHDMFDPTLNADRP